MRYQTMRPVLFKIGNLSFYTHGTFLVLAMLSAGIFMYVIAKNRNRNPEAVFDLSIFSLLAGVVAARITYFFVYRDQFYSFLDIVRVWQGGLVSWGGFIVGVLTFLLILRIYREPSGPWLDILGLSGLIGIAIGRIGSFFSGELAGRATDSFTAISGVHPVTLYESVILSIFFGAMFWLYKKERFAREGDCFLFVLLGYSLVRFVLDFIRTDPTASWGLTMTQTISALIVVAVIVYLGFRTAIAKKGARHA